MYPGLRSAAVVCACGAEMRSAGLVPKKLLSILGEVEFTRSRYECPGCGRTRYPGDEELDVVGTSRSPGLRRMMARAGPYRHVKPEGFRLILAAAAAGLELIDRPRVRLSQAALFAPGPIGVKM